MRQKIRRFLLLISMLLFPVTLYYFSPAQLVESAQNGYITIAVIVFCLLCVAALLFGRAYCGFLCPVGAVGESCFRIQDSKPVSGKRYYLKYLLCAGFMSAVVYFFIRAGGIRFNLLYKTDHGISVTKYEDYTALFGAFFFFITVNLVFGKRAFCHYLCPTAVLMILFSKIKEFINYPSLRLAKTEVDCIACGKCQEICPMSIDITDNMKKGNLYDPECIHCGECVDRCPKGVLKLAFVNRR